MARGSRSEYLIVDLETVPDLSRWDRPEAPEGTEPKFPPTWAHRIVGMGTLVLDGEYRLRELAYHEGGDDAAERALIAAFSARVDNERPVLVTYNGRTFDLPVILLRALCHAVPLPWYYRDRDVRDRKSDAAHLDLCDWLGEHGAVRAGKLDAIARLIGLPGKGEIDGSKVEGLYASGQRDVIERYCLADVAQTALLFLRFRLLSGRLDPDRFAARERELRDEPRIAALLS